MHWRTLSFADIMSNILLSRARFCQESTVFPTASKSSLPRFRLPSSSRYRVASRGVSFLSPGPRLLLITSLLSSPPSLPFSLSRAFLRAATFPVRFAASSEVRCIAQPQKRKEAHSSALSPICISSCGASSEGRAVRSLVHPFVFGTRETPS